MSLQFPRPFLLWCAVKTSIQLSLSVISMVFIAQSGFFVPWGYDASVWHRDNLVGLLPVQAAFELIDLVMETWVTLTVQTKGSHLPYDSIVHHLLTASYYVLVYRAADLHTTAFLGMPVAGLSCQVIGMWYTTHRLRLPVPHWVIGMCMLVVQLLYRSPLALVSMLRAVEHWDDVPYAHFGICAALLTLDIRWIQFQRKLFARRHPRRAPASASTPAAEAMPQEEAQTLAHNKKLHLEREREMERESAASGMHARLRSQAVPAAA